MASIAPFALRTTPTAWPPIVAADVVKRTEATTRVMLWQLPSHLLCSIIGTCLWTSQLRRLVAKVLARDLDAMTDVEVHTEAVSLAASREPGGRALHKELDTRHAGWIKRFGRNTARAALGDAWAGALASGDVPGAYWAILSHPVTDHALTKRVFGDVHMLSHLVGAANRADIRRLTALEAERAALSERVERQQNRLRVAFAERDLAQSRLETLLAGRAGETMPASTDGELDALRRLVQKQRDELVLAASRHDAVERRASNLRQERDRARADGDRATRDAALLRAELGAVDFAHRGRTGDAGNGRLDDLTILYVGGLAANLPALRDEVEARGATFLHHDGGVEERSGLLAGLVGRCDVSLFPVDCVSHEASLALKRLCGQHGRPFVALRSAGWSSLAVALDRFATTRATA
jgi:Uncharacterized protein conserved in bacteria (DUF2325)